MRPRVLSKETRAKLSESLKRYHAEREAAGLPNPSRENSSAAMRAHWADPDKKARTSALMSKGSKASWADPKKKAERLAKYNATQAANGSCRHRFPKKKETQE